MFWIFRRRCLNLKTFSFLEHKGPKFFLYGAFFSSRRLNARFTVVLFSGIIFFRKSC